MNIQDVIDLKWLEEVCQKPFNTLDVSRNLINVFSQNESLRLLAKNKSFNLVKEFEKQNCGNKKQHRILPYAILIAITLMNKKDAVSILRHLNTSWLLLGDEIKNIFLNNVKLEKAKNQNRIQTKGELLNYLKKMAYEYLCDDEFLNKIKNVKIDSVSDVIFNFVKFVGKDQGLVVKIK